MPIIKTNPFTLPDAIVDGGVVAGCGNEATSSLSDMELSIFEDDFTAGNDDDGNSVDHHAFEDVEVACVMMSLLFVRVSKIKSTGSKDSMSVPFVPQE